MKQNEPKRHLFIPDTQIRPGVPTDHVDWIAQAIVDYLPDVVIVGGDWFDMPSLNGHEKPGSLPMEGARYDKDIEVGNEAFARLCAPMEKEQARRKRNKAVHWNPRKIFLTGNHEDRCDRAALNDPKWFGHIGSENCDVRDFERYGFLERVTVDEILYAHFFRQQHSNFPIGGEIPNRLNKIGCSFVQGHEQGFRYGNKILASGKTIHGVQAGSAYLQVEDYRGAQGQNHFRGIIILNEVEAGDFCIMPLSLKYLCRKFERKSLFDYMAAKYRGQDWTHLK